MQQVEKMAVFSVSGTRITVCWQLSLMKQWTACSVVTFRYIGLHPLCDRKVKMSAMRFNSLGCLLVDKETAGRVCPLENATAPRNLRLRGFLLAWQEALAVRPMMYTFSSHQSPTSSCFILSRRNRVKRYRPDTRGWRGANRCGRRHCVCVCVRVPCKVHLVIHIPRQRLTPTQKTTRPPNTRLGPLISIRWPHPATSGYRTW